MVFIVSERLRVAIRYQYHSMKFSMGFRKKKKSQILSSTQGVMCVLGKKRERLYPPLLVKFIKKPVHCTP